MRVLDLRHENNLATLSDMGEIELWQKDQESPWWGEYLAQYKNAARYVRGKKVLDIGCGHGFGSQYLRENGALSVTGVDIRSSQILRAQEFHGGEGIGFIVADVKNLPFASKTFDVVTCFQVLETLPSVDEALLQVARVLTPEGIAVFSTVNRKRFSQLAEAPSEISHLQEYDIDEVKGLLKRAFPVYDIQGLFCTRLTSLDNKTLEFLRHRLENRIPWKVRNQVSQKFFGVSYYPDESEYVLRSLGMNEALLFYAICHR